MPALSVDLLKKRRVIREVFTLRIIVPDGLPMLVSPLLGVVYFDLIQKQVLIIPFGEDWYGKPVPTILGANLIPGSKLSFAIGVERHVIERYEKICLGYSIKKPQPG